MSLSLKIGGPPSKLLSPRGLSRSSFHDEVERSGALEAGTSAPCPSVEAAECGGHLAGVQESSLQPPQEEMGPCTSGSPALDTVEDEVRGRTTVLLNTTCGC